MHFERSLKRALYAPWKDEYIDYHKLKLLLRDDGSDAGSVAGADDEDDWSEKDEEAFVEELINVQLEKVHNFQSTTVQKLRDQTAACEARLDTIAVREKQGKQGDDDEENAHASKSGGDEETLKSVIGELDTISTQMNELEKFSRINYTGFLKAAKKHDRRRGNAYRVMPIMKVRLAELPFNKEDYSPLLFRVSTMYTFCRHRLGGQEKDRTQSEVSTNLEEYKSHKFWVHQDNLLEVKTILLRHLPALIYNPSTSKVVEGYQKDPTMTSIYFDNPQFSLYNAKVGLTFPATSLRLRWYDQLSEAPEIFCELKSVYEDDTSKDQKFVAKPKYIQGFLKGEHKMEKEVKRLADRVGEESNQVTKLKQTISDIQSFIQENSLQPMVRANYTRTAFQMPGDNRVRITLDTDLALIREDSLDEDRPCRNPEDWHRKDIDDVNAEYPFDEIRKGEINRFPYVLLEIRLKGSRRIEWIEELTNSHLVKSAPRFSKFVQGVADLFDDYVNTFPFWLSEVDTDIRKDPQEAFEEEQERRLKAAEAEIAVGSLLTTHSKSFPSGVKTDMLSPVGSPSVRDPTRKSMSRSPNERASAKNTRVDKANGKTATDETKTQESSTTSKLKMLFPSFSMSKYAQARRQTLEPRPKGYGTTDVVGPSREHPNVLAPLPEGVQEPSFWIKDEGEVKVEAKVWLANQRTYVKWQHIAILLASLSVGLFNAAGESNNIARTLALVYTVMAIFIALWGYSIYIWRTDLIRRRSGKDFDNLIGPIIVCVGLIVALLLNFGFKYQAIKNDWNNSHPSASSNLSFSDLDMQGNQGSRSV